MSRTYERRTQILKLLCRRRHDTIENLAFETGVSERTVRRDIDELSLYEPIYTVRGRHGGGVYVSDNFSFYRMYMNDGEISVLKRVLEDANRGKACDLSAAEKKTLEGVIGAYTKPSAGRRAV